MADEYSGAWSDAGCYGSTDDELMRAYLAGGSGTDTPDVIWTTGRVYRAMGGTIPDSLLDQWFVITADGNMEFLDQEDSNGG